RPWHETTGEIGGIAICSDNISARKHAELALRESETRFRGLVTATSDAVYRMSPNWDEMRELHGKGFLSDTSMGSRDWLAKYIPPEEQAHVLEAIDEAVRTRTDFARGAHHRCQR